VSCYPYALSFEQAYIFMEREFKVMSESEREMPEGVSDPID
jgi:hypothetical protein